VRIARRLPVLITILAASVALGGLTCRPLQAALAAGNNAPPFTVPATIGGKIFTFSMAEALKKGPVVLYFYPAAFTEGCTAEAHDFADNIGNYKKLGATVIGVSKDDLKKLKAFSKSECRSKFAVASDADLRIAKSYDAVVNFERDSYANRISYVISQDGKIVYEYSSLDPDKHVANTLAALRRLQGTN
jgi:thioredoxin-dependent peroxiredoxin